MKKSDLQLDSFPTREEGTSALVRVLGPWTAMAVVVGTVIGSGIFKKPREVADNVPDFSLIALLWILGGLLSLLGALALAEVAVLFPRAGGNYVFLREGYGRMAGFLWGWVEFWIIRAASIAALATAFVESLHDVIRQAVTSGSPFNEQSQRYLTVGVIGTLALVNMRGVRWGGGLQFFITLIKVGSLLAVIVLPFVLWSHWEPIEPENEFRGESSWVRTGTALLGILFAYHGWMNIAPIAGEVTNPQRNLPLALLGGTGVVLFLYLGANLAYHLVIPLDVMARLGSTPTVTRFSEHLLGPIGTLLASAAVMCSVFGALNGNLLVGPRVLFAMGEDGLAPATLRVVHPRYHTPARAIAVMAGWSALLVLLAPLVPTANNRPLFDRLTDFAMFGAIIFETLAVTTIFVFRRTMPTAERPYRCLGYPWVPILYLILPAFVLVSSFFSQTTEALTGLGFILVGVLIYLLFLRSKSSAPLFEGLGK